MTTGHPLTDDYRRFEMSTALFSKLNESWWTCALRWIN